MVKHRQHIKLFYFEIFVDNITFYASERDWVDTILTVSYVENHELVVKESKLTSSHVYGKNEDTVIFQGGRSCVFCIEPKLLNNQCSLELIVSRKNKSGDVIQIGSAKVSLGGTYGDLLNSENEKVKKIVQDTRLLKDKKDKSVGSITFAAQLYFYSRAKTGKSEEKLDPIKYQNEEGDVNSVGDSNPNYVMFNAPKKTETFEPYVEESDESLALSVMESAINGLSESKSNDFNFPQIFPDQLAEIESSFAKGDSFHDERTFHETEKQYPLKEKKPTLLLSSGNRDYYDDYRNQDYTGNFKSPFIFNPKAAMKDPYENIPLLLENHPTVDSRKAYYDNKTRDRSSMSLLGYYHGKKRTTYQEDYSLLGNPAQIQKSQKPGLSRPQVYNYSNSAVGRNMTRTEVKNVQPRPYLSPVTLPSLNTYTANANMKYPTIKLNEYQTKNASAKELPRPNVYPYVENGKAKKVDASTNTNTYYAPFSPMNGYHQTKSTNTQQDMGTNTYKYGTYPQYNGHKRKSINGPKTPNYHSPGTDGYSQKPNTNISYSPYPPVYIPKQHVELETRQMQYQNYTPMSPHTHMGRQYERNINTPRYITPQEAYANPYTYGHYANWSPPAPIQTKYEYPPQSPPYYYYRANGMDPQVPKFNAPYRV